MPHEEGSRYSAPDWAERLDVAEGWADVSDEVELISDGDGLAVVGEPSAVSRFMASVGLSSDLRSPELDAVLSTGAAAAQAGSEIAASSSRWVKLTPESAALVKKVGLMDTKTPGIKHAMVGQPGGIKSWIQIVDKPTQLLTNPAVLAGGAGIMAELAMQQTMKEITDYLAVIDGKLDDVLRTQTNQVLARMDGVELAIKEANSVRDSVGRVSDVTWSKVQATSGTILETQAFALRQLKDLTEKLERQTKFGDLADVVEEAEAEVAKWLVVLARCFQLNDEIAILELDRVRETAPEELDRHRLGLRAAREDRRELMAQRTEDLLTRMNAAVGTANLKVLLHPTAAPAVVEARNKVATDVHEFHGVLGIESGHEASKARPWKEAAAESWDIAREIGADGVEGAKKLGAKTTNQARSVKGKVAGRVAKLRKSEDD